MMLQHTGRRQTSFLNGNDTGEIVPEVKTEINEALIDGNEPSQPAILSSTTKDTLDDNTNNSHRAQWML